MRTRGLINSGKRLVLTAVGAMMLGVLAVPSIASASTTVSAGEGGFLLSGYWTITLNQGPGDASTIGVNWQDQTHVLVYGGNNQASTNCSNAGGGNVLCYVPPGRRGAIYGLLGDRADNLVTGTNFAMWVEAGDGPDSVQGSLGTDMLIGGNGEDTLKGGVGNDIVYGDVPGFTGGYNDTITGGAGNDLIYAQGGNDTVNVASDLAVDTVDCGLGGADVATADRARSNFAGDGVSACETVHWK